MKKSTRWILLSTLSIVVIILVVNGLLYRQFRLGHVTTAEQEQASRRVHFRLTAVRHLILSGTIWVNIIPADSNAIQVPMEQIDQPGRTAELIGLKGPNTSDGSPSFRQSNDTLYVRGSNDQPLHRPFVDWYYRRDIPQIYVYASALHDIRVLNGQILVKGWPVPAAGRSLQLAAQHSTVWLGEMDDQPEGSTSRRKFPDEFFDSVSLHLTNSILLLNRPATIADLQARIDSSSELNDRSASLGRPRIIASADSRVSFTGHNLFNTTITTE